MLETVYNILKVSAIVACIALFMSAIYTFVSLIVSIVFANIIGEVFALASMFLPFNASVIFASILTAISAILAFLIAKKIFDLTSWSISAV